MIWGGAGVFREFCLDCKFKAHLGGGGWSEEGVFKQMLQKYMGLNTHGI